MVGEAGSKRPPGEGKELRPTNSRHPAGKGTKRGETKSRNARARLYTFAHAAHGGLFARSYKSKTLEMELMQPEVIAQIILFDELS
jgi:hypothetical protein